MYYIDSGYNADFEVDYEQEASQLIRSSKEDLVRKQDFIDILFGDPRQSKANYIKCFNLADREVY